MCLVVRVRRCASALMRRAAVPGVLAEVHPRGQRPGQDRGREAALAACLHRARGMDLVSSQRFAISWLRWLARLAAVLSWLAKLDSFLASYCNRRLRFPSAPFETAGLALAVAQVAGAPVELRRPGAFLLVDGGRGPRPRAPVHAPRYSQATFSTGQEALHPDVPASLVPCLLFSVLTRQQARLWHRTAIRLMTGF